MSEALKDFLVEIGFLHNTSEQARVEAAVKSTEEKITGTVSAGLQRRLNLERQSAEDRKRAAAEVGEALYKMAMGLSAKTEKAEVETGERAEKRESEAGKRAAARLKDQLKQHEAVFLQVSRLATGLGTAFAGALASAPFGSFLIGVERTATAMSRLAVQSKVLGTSVREIDKYKSAMRQAGVDEGEAMGVLNSFSSKMKDNPEVYRQALERLHVRTLGPDGKPLSYAEMLENFGEHLSTLQPYQARIQAGQFGVNSDVGLNALMDSKTFRKNLNAEDDRMRALGLDPDKVAFQARRVEQEYDRMQDSLRLINLKVQSEFFLPMMEGFNKFADWLEAHPEETKKLEQGLVAFAGVVSLKVIPQIVKLASALTGINATKPPTWLLALLGVEGAKMLAENTVSNVDAWKGESAAEFYTRAADPGLADRIYGKRGEQQLHGPHHGLGVHPQPKDDRNLWQRTMPKALGGKDAPEGASPKPSPIERLRKAARGPRREAETAADVPAGPVPGASGYGLTNAYWRGNLDAKGEGGHLSPRELFDYLKSRGATDNEAVMLTGAASSESSFNPSANHDPAYPGGPPTGHGLWGHKHSRIDMRGMNWQQQADAALAETRGKLYAGRIAAARTPEELADAEMYYEGPRGFKPGNPRAGDNYMGRLNSIRRFSTMANSATSSNAPIGDQAALDAQNRITAGKTRDGDRALIDEHRRQQNTPPTSTSPAKVEVVKQALDPARQKLADAMNADNAKRLHDLAQHLVDLQKAGKLTGDYLMRTPRHMGLSSISANRTHNERHGDTFHVHARTVEEGMQAAERASARRGGKDGIRNGASSQQ